MELGPLPPHPHMNIQMREEPGPGPGSPTLKLHKTGLGFSGPEFENRPMKFAEYSWCLVDVGGGGGELDGPEDVEAALLYAVYASMHNM